MAIAAPSTLDIRQADGYALLVDGLTYRYPDGRPALRGVSLRVERGEKLAIVGPNGAGKSTFVLHLNGLLQGEGSLEVLGRRVLPRDERVLGEVRALVGLVFQDPDDQLFSPTVYDDVAFGPIYMGHAPAEVERHVEDALRMVGLEGYQRRMPHHLSGGEKKRVALASVLSMHPEVLCLDEPSAGLDPRARRGLIRLLQELPQTILVTTHDMHMVKEIFPRTVIMDQGIVVGDGPTGEILADQALLEAHGLELP